MSALKAADAGVELRRVEFVGPQVGQELLHNGLMALLVVVLGIVIYLGFRFEWKFAVAGVIANLRRGDHPGLLRLLPVGILALGAGRRAGGAGLLGERIRGHHGPDPRELPQVPQGGRAEVINSAITQTISRTIITHGSTQMMVLAMLFFGGPTLHYFAMA